MSKIKNNLEQEILQRTLKDVRIRKGLMQTEIAKKLKLPQSFVSKYECGDRRLDIIELKSICKVLEITLTSFVEEYEANLKEHETK